MFYAVAGVVRSMRRAGTGAFGLPSAWSNSLDEVSGLAAYFELDHNVLLSGVDAGGVAGVWSTILGAGGAQADGVWQDLEEVAARCRFGDCRHAGEPGCAVQDAIASGHLDADRLEGLRKLERETAFLARRGDARARAEERRRWRALSREMRQRERQKRRGGRR